MPQGHPPVPAGITSLCAAALEAASASDPSQWLTTAARAATLASFVYLAARIAWHYWQGDLSLSVIVGTWSSVRLSSRARGHADVPDSGELERWLAENTRRPSVRRPAASRVGDADDCPLGSNLADQ